MALPLLLEVTEIMALWETPLAFLIFLQGAEVSVRAEVLLLAGRGAAVVGLLLQMVFHLVSVLIQRLEQVGKVLLVQVETVEDFVEVQAVVEEALGLVHQFKAQVAKVV